MRLLNLLAYGGLVLCLGGCAGVQSDRQTVSGDSGPGFDARADAMVRQVNAPANQTRLQEQLLKQSAMLPLPEFKDYRIGPEDLLQIGVLNVDKLNTEARVNGQGQIRVLLVGDVDVNGLTAMDVSKKLAKMYRDGRYLVDPQITVAVKEFRHQRVAVTGAVNKPDHYALIGPRTLLEVLGMAGGLSDKAGEVVNVIRPQTGPAVTSVSYEEQSSLGGARITLVDLNELLLNGAVSLNVPIQNGDIVFVPFARSAYVLGAVSKPGGVLVKENLTVSKAVSQAGGINPVIGSDNATVLRTDGNGRRITVPVDLGRIAKGSAEDVALRENDIVFVHESGARRFLFDIKSLFPASIGLIPPLY